MSRPKRISILGQWYDIHFVRKPFPADDDLAGIVNETEIIIADDGDESWHDTLLHECVHAALIRSGLGECISENLEEAIVQALENALGPIFKLDEDSDHIKWARSSRLR